MSKILSIERLKRFVKRGLGFDISMKEMYNVKGNKMGESGFPPTKDKKITKYKV